LFKKEYGVEYSDKEAWEATHNLLGFFDLLLKMDRKQQKMKGEKQGGVK
jgi:protein-tyrosine-phosphatase